MGLELTGMKCINCKTPVKDGQINCRKCGDRVVSWTQNSKIDPGFISEIKESAARLPVRPVEKPAITPTGEQAAAVEKVRQWFEDTSPRVAFGKRPFRLFGPAGTGKTTLVKYLQSALSLDNVVYGAYTGKAAHVLRTKGIPATTIHSAVYTPRGNAAPEELAALKAELAEVQKPDALFVPNRKAWEEKMADLQQQIEELEAWMRRPRFEFNPGSEWAYADLIVLDEVSMVNDTMASDIESYGVPVLVLGDPAQLPPIEGGGYYTNVVPDVLLETIHRQALESPVLKLATDIRLGQSWASAREGVSLDKAMTADQILCWKNSTRWALIEKIRAKLGRPKGVPVPGDRVMCLVNNKDIGVFNGQQFEVIDSTGFKGYGDDTEHYVLELRDDDGLEREILADPNGFKGLDGEREGKAARRFRGEIGLFTFANVITTHKAQGSEWPHVYVVDQTHQMTRFSAAEKRAWMYTATTRASDRVTVASTEVR